MNASNGARIQMTLDQLRIFVAVAQREHITKAASDLNMTQSAVSAAVTALETRHGVSLFDRVGRSIVLNEAGRVFLPEAIAVLTRAGAAESALSDLSGLTHGTLLIAASQTVAGYWLPARLAGFKRKHPGIEIKLSIGNTADVARAVRDGAAELGVVEGEVDQPQLTRRVVAVDQMLLVVSSDHPWASQKKITKADLSGGNWVMRELGSGTRAALEKLLTRTGIDLASLHVELVLPTNETVIGAVQAGAGATLISESAARAQLVAGSLVAVPVKTPKRPFTLVRHVERYRSKAGDAFATDLE